MAKMPKKSSGDSTGDWLNTYADMVTLLLTFFVLLFACSNLDETKLQYVFQEFQSRGKYVNNVLSDLDPAAESTGGVTDDKTDVGGEGEMPQSFDELYVFLADYVDKNNLADTIAVEQGAAHITIRFDDSVFFDGDSYALKDEGREVLNGIIPAIKTVQQAVRTVTVSGHTSKAVSAVNDWALSSMRAVSVVNYLEWNNMVDSSKYRVKGCGPHEPIADNDTLEGQQKNRRVEMMILKEDLDLTDPEVIKDILSHDFGLDSDDFDPDGNNDDDYTKLPDGSVDKIIGYIEDKFSDNSGYSSSGVAGPSAVDDSLFLAPAGTAEDSGGDDGDSENGAE